MHGASTELAPFWRDHSRLFLSADVRNVQSLGYTYADTSVPAANPPAAQPRVQQAPAFAPPPSAPSIFQQQPLFPLLNSFFSRIGRRLSATSDRYGGREGLLRTVTVSHHVTCWLFSNATLCAGYWNAAIRASASPFTLWSHMAAVDNALAH
jgi:hypothetical protein